MWAMLWLIFFLLCRPDGRRNLFYRIFLLVVLVHGNGTHGSCATKIQNFVREWTVLGESWIRAWSLPLGVTEGSTHDEFLCQTIPIGIRQNHGNGILLHIRVGRPGSIALIHHHHPRNDHVIHRTTLETENINLTIVVDIHHVIDSSTTIHHSNTGSHSRISTSPKDRRLLSRNFVLALFTPQQKVQFRIGIWIIKFQIPSTTSRRNHHIQNTIPIQI
mmetsp:Transcript_25344/g.37030  ORF Transcript_25344/g.37030 Transcript_25344/m.37030 type:complete len:218 (+) Transcript_25344:1042-1695(+)